MRQRPDESYADWVERVRTYELAEALKEVRKGADINLVMEAMSARLMKKIMHPLLVAVRESSHTEYNADEGRRKYFEALSQHKPVADHVFDENNPPKIIDED